MRLVVFVLGMVAALVPAALQAQSYTPAAVTPTQLLAKARAARGTLHVHRYREAYSTVKAGRTILSETLIDGDNYVHTTTDGPNSFSDGRANGTDWERNANGVVVPMTDYYSTADPFRTALQTVDDVSPKTRVLGITSDAHPAIVLELQPRNALRQLRYYDATTYLLQRVETTDYAGITAITQYGDYQPFAGLLIARTISYHNGRPENDATSTVTRIEPVNAADAAAFAPPASSRPFVAPERTPVEIPATFTPAGIIVRLTIAGRGLDFVLDSGASDTVIDTTTAKSLGLSLYGSNVVTIGGDVHYSRARVPDASLGALHAHDLAVDVLPFSDDLGDIRAVGLLGSDFFASGAVTIDLRNHRITIATGAPSGAPDGYSKLPISIDDYVPFVKATFNGKEGTFIADLGASNSVLYPHYFEQFKAPYADETGGMQFVGGETKTRSYRFSHVELGDFILQDVLVAVPSNHKVEDTYYDGLLGRDLMRYFTLIFDYPEQAIYLKPIEIQ